MKIKELIEKMGDKLISQKDKLAYNMAVKKLELIAKIPNKEQRSEAMGKFKDVLAKKVTPVVMAALTAISPVVLAGCDESKNPNETQIAYVTDTNGEYVTDSNGNPETTIITTPAGTIPDFEFKGLTEKMKENLHAYFADFDFGKVLNGDYSKSVNNYLKYSKNKDLRKDLDAEILNQALNPYQCISLDGYQWDEYFFSKVTGGDDKIALDIDLTGADATITFYREGTETAGFILRYPNGQTVYNGVFNNEVYADGQEYLKNIPLAINEERKVALEQLNSSELGKIYGDGIISYFFNTDLLEKLPCSKPLVMTTCYPERGRAQLDSKLIKTTTPGVEINYDGIIPVYLSVPLIYETIGSESKNDELQELYFDVGETVESSSKIIAYRYAVNIVNPVRLASIQLDLEPQNVQLPTTEAEAEK